MPMPEPRAPYPSVVTDRPVFEPDVLGAMFNNDTGVITALLQTFVASTSAGLADISKATAAQDLTAVAALAHRVAGASRLSGAQRFGDLAATVESAAKRDDLAAVQATLDELAELWRQVRHAMGPLPQD